MLLHLCKYLDIHNDCRQLLLIYPRFVSLDESHQFARLVAVVPVLQKPLALLVRLHRPVVVEVNRADPEPK